jgi:hypothetical protein
VQRFIRDSEAVVSAHCPFESSDHVEGLTTHAQSPGMFKARSNRLKSVIPYGPKVPDIPKMAAEDTTLMASNRDGTKTSIPVPAGTMLTLHVPGIHYNRMLSRITSRGLVLMKSHSAILEGSPSVQAREISRGLAQGCLPSV